jgi:hypothetical protein
MRAIRLRGKVLIDPNDDSVDIFWLIFVLVSASRANAIKLGWRKPLPVLVRINGEPAKAWRINMMPVRDGSFYLYLRGEVRKASGTAVGDRVRVEIEFDASYRNGPQHPMPAWFQQGLAGPPSTK